MAIPKGKQGKARQGKASKDSSQGGGGRPRVSAPRVPSKNACSPLDPTMGSPQRGSKNDQPVVRTYWRAQRQVTRPAHVGVPHGAPSTLSDGLSCQWSRLGLTIEPLSIRFFRLRLKVELVCVVVWYKILLALPCLASQRA